MKKMRQTFQGNRVRQFGLFTLCLLIAAVFTNVTSLYAQVQVSASLNATNFPMDRAAALSITARGTRSFEAQIPEVDGLRFHRQGQSTQFELINGDYSASVTYVYLVQGLREGKFTIPPIPIVTKKETLLTQAIDVEVTAPYTASVSTQAPSTGSSKARLRSGEAEKVAFMRVEPAKEKSYSGEIVPVRIKVYFREGIKANLNTLPQLKGEGFVLQQLAREPVQAREVINNIEYAVLTWDSALSGIKEGAHTISLDLEATLLLRDQRRRPSRSLFNDPFFHDSFFDDFFGSYREKEVKVVSPELEMDVLPLPAEGRPPGFNGAIGDFQLLVTADPLVVEQGEPVTLTMTVAGLGNFDRVQAPQLSQETGWKSYTPSSEFLKDGRLGQGKKVFEQALVAKDATLTEIPAVIFSYFDPTAAVYKTLSSPPIPFKLRGAPVQEKKIEALGNAAQGVEETVTETVPGSEPLIVGLAPLQLEPGNMEQGMEPLFAKRWFLGMVCLVVLLFFALAVMRLRAIRYANNPRLQRDKAMQQLLALRLQELEKAISENDSRRFLATCRRAIQEQLGLVWESEAGAITLADLRQRLAGESSLITIFSAAEESAYGGQELNSRQMQDFAGRLQKELEGLL